MKYRLARRAFSVTLVLLLVPGCGALFGDQGVFRDRSEDYKRAPELPAVRVPDEMDTGALHEIYVIPDIDDNVVLPGEFEVPRPAPLVAGQGSDVVRIQKLGDESWALVALAPGQVWPQVRNFLTAAGMQVARVDPRAGIIDSNWITLEGKPLQSRFRFRMDQGVQRGTSELHVLQMNQTGRPDEWPRESDDAEQAGEMLRAVAQYLADSADASPVSMVAEQGIRAGGKISMQEAKEGYSYIRLELPFYRAWASLGLALEESAFEITDRDRSGGIYYVRFIGPEADEEGGWFDWLWGEDDHPMAGQEFIVSMESLSDEVVTIRLRPQDPQAPFDKREEQGLLSLIKGSIN